MSCGLFQLARRAGHGFAAGPWPRISSCRAARNELGRNAGGGGSGCALDRRGKSAQAARLGIWQRIRSGQRNVHDRNGRARRRDFPSGVGIREIRNGHEHVWRGAAVAAGTQEGWNEDGPRESSGWWLARWAWICNNSARGPRTRSSRKSPGYRRTGARASRFGRNGSPRREILCTRQGRWDCILRNSTK